MRISLPCGERSVVANIHDRNLTALVRSRNLIGLKNEKRAIRAALRNPIESPRLSEMTGCGKKVTVVIDDITRPTPTRKILQPVLEELGKADTHDKDVTIVVASGLHRKVTNREKERMIGKDIMSRVKVMDHDAQNKRAMTKLGVTARGTPV